MFSVPGEVVSKINVARLWAPRVSPRR